MPETKTEVQPRGFGAEDAGMRSRSGEIDDANPLVSLLYLLMRDDIAPGRLEQHVTNLEGAADKDSEPFNAEFSNGWLALYARDLAARLHRIRCVAEAQEMKAAIGRLGATETSP